MGKPASPDSASAEETPSPTTAKGGVSVEKTEHASPGWAPPPEWLDRLVAEYTDKHEGEALPPGSEPMRVAQAILTLNEEDSVKTLLALRQSQRNDYTIDQKLLQRFDELVQGHEHCNMEQGEWAYTVCKAAGTVHNWSPYAEVRAVTLPYDDVDEACESFRAYLLGFFWVCVVTAVNTCELEFFFFCQDLWTVRVKSTNRTIVFNPRQPGISIPNPV